MTLSKFTIATLGAVAFAAPAVAQDAPTTTETPSAQEQCRTERAGMGKELFATTYGTNANKRNAFGKCVSKRNAATEEAAAEAKTNAAKECQAERDADEAAFTAKYGTNPSKSNAYGKCVSGKAKAETAETVEAQVEADINAAKSCKAERKLDPAAFKAKYGTNKTKSNAFGKCVSKTAQAQEDKPEESAPAAA